MFETTDNENNAYVSYKQDHDRRNQQFNKQLTKYTDLER